MSMPSSPFMTLPRSRLLAPLSLAATLLATTTCHDSQGPRSPTAVGRAPVPMMAAAVPNAVTLVGTGNIARCDRTNDEATAAILDTIAGTVRSEEHTSELQSRLHLVCRLLLEKK